MRAYLSSYRLGNRPEELLTLLRGGRRAAMIGNAADYLDGAERAAAMARELADLAGLGLEPFEVDLRDHFGRPGALREVLGGVDLIYPRGGNVYLLRRALRQSGGDEILTELLRADAVVYSGYSAGPCMLGPTLRGIVSVEDDPTVVPPGYRPEVVWEGLGLLPCALVPHHRPDEPDSSIGYYRDHGIPYVTLRDGQALVIDGDRQDVVG
ncbi:MAG: Type 1 glutamine amidotransferase-like domain-containing protein [Mycobacteriales bacterium]